MKDGHWVRRFAPLSLLLLCLPLAGCDGYVSASEHQARLQIADYEGWIRAKADSRDERIREIGNVQVGSLRHGEETSIPLDVTGAHRALVIAACDRELRRSRSARGDERRATHRAR